MTDQQAKASRDPVAPAQRSEDALHKVYSRSLEDGTEAHGFRTLIRHLGGIVRNTCRVPGVSPDTPPFEVKTTPGRKQQIAFKLLNTLRT